MDNVATNLANELAAGSAALLMPHIKADSPEIRDGQPKTVVIGQTESRPR